MRFRRVLVATAIFLVMSSIGRGQEPKKAETAAKPAVSASARLAAAKTVFMKNGGGSAIPYNVISGAMEGWGRYQVVDTPAKADLIVEVTSPEESGGVSVSSTTTRSGASGGTEQTSSSSRQLSGTAVRMVVYDAKNKVPLWSGSEQAKSAMRQKAREDNLVEAGQRLIAKFRERVEK